MKENNIQQNTLIEELKEYKKYAEKEFKKKNAMILAADQKRNEAYESLENERFKIRDNDISQDDLRTRLEVRQQEVNHFQALIDAMKVEKEEVELARLKIKGKYTKIKAEFEARVDAVDYLSGKLDFVEKKMKETTKELDPMRVRVKDLEEALEIWREDYMVMKTKKKDFERDNRTILKDLKISQQQVQELNESRHKLVLDNEQIKQEAEHLLKQRDVANDTIDKKQTEIKKLDGLIANLKLDALAKEEANKIIVGQL